MARKKTRPKRAKGPPDPLSRDCFYLLEVADFALAGGASRWYPDEFPDIYDQDYFKSVVRPVLHEDLDLHLLLRPIDPPMADVVHCSASLHGQNRFPEPDTDFYGGSISKRRDNLEFWFRSRINVPRDLAASLLAGQRIFVRFQGARLYRGRASLCGLEWWTSDHPDLLAEFEDLGFTPAKD